MRDPYDVLGVSKSASAADIKSAFRKLAKKLHPDANKHDPKAASRFAELNAAYEILGEADKRKAFDRGEIDAEGKPRFQGFEGFGGGRGRGGFGREGGFRDLHLGIGWPSPGWRPRGRRLSRLWRLRGAAEGGLRRRPRRPAGGFHRRGRFRQRPRYRRDARHCAAGGGQGREEARCELPDRQGGRGQYPPPVSPTARPSA